MTIGLWKLLGVDAAETVFHGVALDVIVRMAFGGDMLWRVLGEVKVVLEDCIICSFDGLKVRSTT